MAATPEDTRQSAAESEGGGSAAFDFVQKLNAELQTEQLRLPSLPTVAVRIQRALASEGVTQAEVARVVSSEPALALRVLQMANSAALNPGGRNIVELRTAVTRLGFNLVRGAAVVFLVEQLERSHLLRNVRPQLHRLWQRSVLVGSLGYVIARRFTAVNPDTALLCGLLHGVGQLAILSRAAEVPQLLADVDAYERIVHDWHSGIAHAVLRSWEVPQEIIQAVHDFEHLERENPGPVDLTDVLAVSDLLVAFENARALGGDTDAEMRLMRLKGIKIWGRLRIDRAGCEAVIAESANEIAALRAVLRG